MSVTGFTELRIGATEAGLLELRYRGIPDPDEWSYTPYSIVRTDGNGLQKGYGFPTASWSWESMDQMALAKFIAFFDSGTDAGVQVYISTYTDTGWRQEVSDYTAYMQRPIDGEGKSLYPQSGGRAVQNITVNFTHLEAV